MSDTPTPNPTPPGPPRRRAVLLAALVGSTALHAALIFGPDLTHRGADDRTVAVVPVQQLPPKPVEPVAPTEPEPLPEPEPEPQPPTPEPDHAAEPPTPTPPAATPPPEPHEPTPPPVVDATPPAADDTASGSFAGNTNGRRGPTLRIDWGTPADALARVRRGGLQLAVLNTASGARITHAVRLTPDGGAQRDAAPALHRFDPEARIVGNAPAFAQAARSLGLASHEHLVILLPRPLADQARLAQRTFIRRQGHRWEDVAVTTAVLDAAADGLRARVTGLHVVR